MLCGLVRATRATTFGLISLGVTWFAAMVLPGTIDAPYYHKCKRNEIGRPDHMSVKLLPLPIAHSSLARSQTSKPTQSPSTPKKQRLPAPTPGTTLYSYRGYAQAVKCVAWVSKSAGCLWWPE